LTTPSAGPSRRHRARSVAAWTAQIVLAVQFAASGALKLSGDTQMLALFAEIGAGQWLRAAVGVLELAGAVGLLVPRLAAPAAAGLVALMAGATFTNVAVLGSSPVLPIMFGILATVVLIVRWHRLAGILRPIRR
jgi:putative oxidoreductase